MTRIFMFVGLLFLILNFGCSHSNENQYMELAGEDVASSTVERKSVEVLERKLIKEGWVTFETEQLASSRKAILEAVDKYKGYISSDQEFKTSGRISNTIVIRMPSDYFDDLLKDATTGVDKFENKEIKVKDVTEEFLDIQARLKTKKELENRFIELLKQAKNVTEILEIEKQVGILREEIESIEGRFTYLQNRISFSTLTLTFYESIPIKRAFGNKFNSGFRNGWDNLIMFFVALTHIWPFIILGLLFILGMRMYRRKK